MGALGVTTEAGELVLLRCGFTSAAPVRAAASEVDCSRSVAEGPLLCAGLRVPSTGACSASGVFVTGGRGVPWMRFTACSGEAWDVFNAARSGRTGFAGLGFGCCSVSRRPSGGCGVLPASTARDAVFLEVPSGCAFIAFVDAGETGVLVLEADEDAARSVEPAERVFEEEKRTSAFASVGGAV